MFVIALLAACGSAPLPDATPADAATPPLGMVLTPLVAGHAATATIYGAPRGTEVALVATSSTASGSSCPPAIAPTCLDLPNPIMVLGRLPANPNGSVIAFDVPDALEGREIRFQAVVHGATRTVLVPVQASRVLSPGADPDADGLTNAEELRWSSDPRVADTDGGGTWDGAEVAVGTSPTDPADDRPGLCLSGAECGADEWCAEVCPDCAPGVDCTGTCFGICSPISWCYSDEGCDGATHCSVSDGDCRPDPSCPACDVCTGVCVDDAAPCASSSSCDADQHCSVEDGVCNPSPDCLPGEPCIDLCFGTCVDDPAMCFDSTECPESKHCTTDDGVCNFTFICDADGVCYEVCSGTCAPDPVPGTPCTSSDACADGARCTTEDGVCNPPPGCGPGQLCPAVCYGTCEPVEPPPFCYSDDDCGGLVCTVSLGACDPDPTCPMCAVCTGTCVEPTPCASSNQCPAGVTCSTEQGDCLRPPGCGPNDPCPDVCYGWCGTGAVR